MQIYVEIEYPTETGTITSKNSKYLSKYRSELGDKVENCLNPRCARLINFKLLSLSWREQLNFDCGEKEVTFFPWVGHYEPQIIVLKHILHPTYVMLM